MTDLAEIDLGVTAPLPPPPPGYTRTVLILGLQSMPVDAVFLAAAEAEQLYAYVSRRIVPESAARSGYVRAVLSLWVGEMKVAEGLLREDVAAEALTFVRDRRA